LSREDSDGGIDHGTRLSGHEADEDDNEYATPAHLWRPLSRAVGGFDLDPASGAESTPIAPVRYTEEEDGLSKAWFGDVWLNPPWSSKGDASAKKRWLRKARNEANRDAVDTVTVCLPADTDSHAFHDHIITAPVWCLVGPGRIPFVGEDRNPTFTLVLAVFGDPPDALVDALDKFGAVVRGAELVDEHPQATLGVVDGE